MNVPIQKAKLDKHAAASPGCVLIVDDDQDFGESLVELLGLHGYQSEYARTGEKALALAGTFEPEVVLLDIRLGRENGIDLIDKLNKVRPGLDCIAMSAHANLDMAVKAVRHNAYDYLRKPFDDRDLVAALERCFEKRRLVREKQEGERRAAEALEASEARLANAQRIAHIGNWDWEIVAGELHWSDEIYRIFGLKPQEFGATYEAFLATIHPDDRTMVEEAVTAALEEQAPYSIDHRIVLPSGEVRRVHEQAEVERDADGAPIAMRGTVQDITERREAEKALKDSFQRLKDFAGSASDFFWEMDANLRFSYFSERFAQVTGVEPELLIGKTRQETRMPGVDPDAWEQHLADLAAHRPFRGFVHPRTRPDGKDVHLSINGSPTFDADGTFKGYRGTGSDISERKQADEAVRESEGRTRGILENVADGVITMGEDGRVESFNLAAEKMFGYAASEIIGRMVTKLMTGIDRRLHSSYVRGYLRAGHSKILGVGPRELIARRKDGSTFPISLAVGEVKTGGKRQFVGSIRDISQSKEAEEALRRSEARLADAQRMAHLGSWQREIETGRTIWSDELYRIFGFHPRSMEPDFDFIKSMIHPDDRDAFIEISQHALENDLDSYESECRIVRGDGTERYIHVRAEIARDETGTPFKLIGTVHDITERKRAEQELEAQSAVLQVILGTMDQGISVADAGLNIIACNAKFLELLEFPPEMGSRRPFEDYIHYNAERGEYGPGDTDEQVRERVEIARQFKAHRFERTRPDGTAIEIRGNPSADGGFVTTYTDITERVQAEEALRRHAQIVDQIHDSVVSTDCDGIVTTWNKGAERLFGYTADEAIGQHISFVYPEEEREHLANQVIAPTLQKGWHDVEVRMRRKSGEDFYAHLSDSVLRDARGEVIGRIGYSVDITERKQSEAALREAVTQAEFANRSKSEFLANMSHELRTPLNAIIGFSEAMHDEMIGPLGNPGYRDYAHNILESGKLLLSLIGDILDLSKIEAGKLELREDNVNVAEAVGACRKIVEGRARDAGLALETRMGGDLPRLWVDERSFKQIILNLLSNAVKFTPTGGRVTVDAATDEAGRFILTVSDTGIGIAAEDIPKALSPFSQVENYLTRERQGTGLGLPLVNSLVEAHGGTLALESKFGIGTTATIVFPAERVVDGIGRKADGIPATGTA